MARPIVFLSDFGLDDGFVGICHGVIEGLAPGTRIIDLTHGIPPGDVVRGAVALSAATPYMPADAVYLAVVDPGVGTDRLALAALTSSGALTVGPDNGLLSLAWDGLGGVEEAVAVNVGPDDPPPSPTFHGRDVFAPAAARLAAGAGLLDIGPRLGVGALARLSLPEAVVGQGTVRTRVLAVDRFGNVQLALRPERFAEAGVAGPSVEVGAGTRRVRARRAATFGDVDRSDWVLLVDSAGWMAVAMNGGNAAKDLDVTAGDEVTLTQPVTSPAEASEDSVQHGRTEHED